jgi:peptide/nickel transport system permease protein
MKAIRSPQAKRRYRSRLNPQLAVGVVLLLIPLVLFVISRFSRYTILEMDPSRRFQGPSAAHWFGTDNYGRDVFVRALSGFLPSVIIAIGTILIGCGGGLLLGGLAGYYGGLIDYWISRFNDAFLSIPAILMGMMFVTAFGGGIWQITVALGIMFIPSFARVVRSGVMQYRNRDFVRRVRLAGSGDLRIMRVHILPLIRPRILSASAVGFANAILAESALSYLGIGVPINQPSWGRMLFDAQGYLFKAPWCAIFAGLLIVTMVLGAFFLGNSFKENERGIHS